MSAATLLRSGPIFLPTSACSNPQCSEPSRASWARTPILTPTRRPPRCCNSLIRNHPFIDGNKRTAVLAVLVFYGLNGHWIEAEQDELVALAVDIAEGILDVEAIAGRLKGWATPLVAGDDSAE